MQIKKTLFPGLVIIEPQVFEDSRGYFFESYHKSRYAKHGVSKNFIQDNESKSAYGVIRGLHYQLEPFAQAKLVRVIEGKVFDVAVDLRENSPTFGKWFGTELSSKNKKQLFIPRGFAHGFSVLSKTAIFAYKCDNIYNREAERVINLADPQLNIDWKLHESKRIISEKDLNAPLFNKAEKKFVYR